MIRILYGCVIASVLSISCRSSKMATASIDIRSLDTLTVVADRAPNNSRGIYRAAATRTIDLQHTQLDLSFDWRKQAVIGSATLTVTPVFYSQDTISLDAVGFDIHLITGSMVEDTLAYTYDGQQLVVALDRPYTRGEEITVNINYTAYPERNETGGSSAITSDKGLFFIDPLDLDPNKPSQIWTQGETENNSRWMPTIDKPNQRCTQDITLTVDSNYVTLSNGLLTSSIDNGDGSRSDRWVMDQPHAPYLFMIAVGEFAVVSESWQGIPLQYYVEPAYAPYAQQIFNHTPEMLTFFSEMLDYPYPWSKYAQIVTRDFVSGAMENTTAVVFGEFVQKTDRQLIDNHNDLIVAHELFHHWFGDLVTCESWSNLTLNEGFANYSEYLWLEYKYGIQAAEAHRYTERQGYFAQAYRSGIHPLIHYSYDDKEDMFDAHSYNKGGLILHMLRDYIGDEAFFASLNAYLTTHAYTAVEVDELRMSFEDVTGMDLQWFFDQWYLSQGHPVLQVSYGHNIDAGLYSVVVSQLQEEEGVLPIYRLPLDVVLYGTDGRKHVYNVELNQRDQLFLLQVDYEVAYAVIDDGYTLLAEIYEEEKSSDEWLAQAKGNDNYSYRMEAIDAIEGTADYYDMADELLLDPYYEYRYEGIDASDINKPEVRQTLATMAQTDSHSTIRAAALASLIDSDYKELRSLTTDILQKEQAYNVLEVAIEGLATVDLAAAVQQADKMSIADRDILGACISAVYSKTGDAKHLSYLEKQLSTMSVYEGFSIYNDYASLLFQLDSTALLRGVAYLKPIATSGGNITAQYAAVKTLAEIRSHIESEKISSQPEDQLSKAVQLITTTIANVKSNTTSQQLQAMIAEY